MTDIVEELRSNEPLPICPYDRKSPLYWTTPDDAPCIFCGQENTLDGEDKCRGADTRLFRMAADEITRLRAREKELENVLRLLNCIDFELYTEHDEALMEDVRAGARALLATPKQQ